MCAFKHMAICLGGKTFQCACSHFKVGGWGGLGGGGLGGVGSSLSPHTQV